MFLNNYSYNTNHIDTFIYPGIGFRHAFSISCVSGKAEYINPVLVSG